MKNFTCKYDYVRKILCCFSELRIKIDRNKHQEIKMILSDNMDFLSSAFSAVTGPITNIVTKQKAPGAKSFDLGSLHARSLQWSKVAIFPDHVAKRLKTDAVIDLIVQFLTKLAIYLGVIDFFKKKLALILIPFPILSATFLSKPSLGRPLGSTLSLLTASSL